jgi:hypothetical protein
MWAGEFETRRAPYAPISALRLFFERIRDRQAPEVVDQRYLAKLNVASKNEYALISALKFLDILDDRGKPTHSYRLLQTTDRFQTTLQHLVLTAYKPVFDLGAHNWPLEDLVNYFRVNSSASQAKNAARFFHAVCALAGFDEEQPGDPDRRPVVEDPTPSVAEATESAQVPAVSSPVQKPGPVSDVVLGAKARLVEKLPVANPSWSASEYAAICETFLGMMRNLDGRS